MGNAFLYCLLLPFFSFIVIVAAAAADDEQLQTVLLAHRLLSKCGY